MSENAVGSFNLDEIAFEQQLKFIRDPARLKALSCTRRAAKSYTGGLYLVEEALKHPMSNCLFVALTRETAKGIIWKDILKDINLKYKLNMVFNGTNLTATLPNGSEIWVTGADADEDEMNKLLGRKYRLVVIDEASMFSINVHQLVYGVLKPAIADQRGTICLLGTASNIARGLFYDIANKKEPGWSLHQWTAFDNPHVATQWAEELADIEKNRPLFKSTALFRQWYLNEWVVDADALIYKFDRARNDAYTLPAVVAPWRNVLGVHLGHAPSPSAFVVARYNEEFPLLFVVHCEQHPMDAESVANKIKKLDEQYSFEVSVVWGLSKKTVNEFNSRHELGVIDSDTQEKEKEYWINLLNSDLSQKKSLFTPQTEELKKELETLVWETSDAGKVKLPRTEHAGLPNHLANALLCVWRHTYPYLYSRKLDGKPEPADWEKKHIQTLTDQARRAQNPHHFDEQFAPDEDLFDFDKDEMI